MIKNIDWKSLREQKAELLDLLDEPDKHKLSFNKMDALKGVVNLIDGIQDYAVDCRNIEVGIVFGDLEE